MKILPKVSYRNVSVRFSRCSCLFCRKLTVVTDGKTYIVKDWGVQVDGDGYLFIINDMGIRYRIDASHFSRVM